MVILAASAGVFPSRPWRSLIMVSLSEEMVKALERERKLRKSETIPEAIRSVLREYFRKELK